MLSNPPIVTPTGDIQLHNQGAVELSISFTDDLGAPQNVAACTMWFEVSNGHRIALTNGATTDIKLLAIAQHALDDILDVVARFVIVDETDTPKHLVKFQGNILVTGWAG